jgi:hypothetical protein
MATNRTTKMPNIFDLSKVDEVAKLLISSRGSILKGSFNHFIPRSPTAS